MSQQPARLVLASAAWDVIVHHARAEAPRECCGLLMGSETAGMVHAAWPARNAAEEDTRFVVNPADHFAAIRAGRERGWSVLGAYHSHPRSPAIPSTRDLQESCGPDWLNVIVSLEREPPSVAAYYYLPDGPVTVVAVRAGDEGS